MNTVRVFCCVLLLVAQITANSNPVEDGVRSHVTSIVDNPLSTKIDVYGEEVEASSARIIAELMTTRDLRKTEITALEIFFTSIGDEGIRAIVEALPNTKITHLTLVGNGIGEDGARAIAEILKITGIIHLNLYYNRLGPNGARFITSALVGSKLTYLDLGFNHIGPEATQALAGILPYTEITGLNLDNNLFGPAEVKLISRNLQKLTALSIGHNQAGDEGAKAIAEALKDSKLTTLEMSNNLITAVGMRAIASALKDSRIIILYFENGGMGKAGLESLLMGLQDTYITGLDIGKELISSYPDICQKITHLLESNEITVASFSNKFVKYVGKGENGRLEFVVDEESGALDYIRFVELLSRKKQSPVDQLVVRDERIYGRVLIEDFVKNIQMRLGELLSKADASMIQRVEWLLECDRTGLEIVVKDLLFHRVDYALNRDDPALKDVLHPAVYVLMEKYGVPWFTGRGKYTMDKDLMGIFGTNQWDGFVKEGELGEFVKNFGKQRLLEIIRRKQRV